MAVIDERGRIFGLINLIDLGVAVLIAAVIAAVAVGYSVFKVPAAPEIVAVEPATQPTGVNLRMVVRGKNFLPFMRVVFQRTGDSAKAIQDTSTRKNPLDSYRLVSQTQARFFVESPTVAEVWLPDVRDGFIDPGSYDLIFFNESQQVGVKEAAFTLTPPPAAPAPAALPLATVRVFGTFTRVDRPDAAGIAVGSKFSSTVAGESGEVLSVGAAEPDIASAAMPARVAGALKIPASLRIRCSFTGTECRVGSTPVSRNGSISLQAKDRTYTFSISDFVTDSSPSATVRASGVFTRLDRADAGRVTAGARFTSSATGESGEVLSVGRAEPAVERIGGGNLASVAGKVQVPATLRMRCVFTGTDCKVWTTKLERDASVNLTLGGRSYAFVVAELAADVAQSRRDARVAVRLVLRPEMEALIKAGDADIHVPAGPNPAPTESARVTAIGARRESTSLTQIAAGESALPQTFAVQEPVVLNDVTLRVPVTEASGAWFYKGQAIKAGAGFVFETAQYVVRGVILSVTLDRDTASPEPPQP